MRRLLRIETACGAVEEANHAFAAAIRHFVEQRPVALRRVLRLDQIKIRGEFDLAGGVLRRLGDVRNNLIRGIAWIDGKVDRAGELFIRTGRSEWLPGE